MVLLFSVDRSSRVEQRRKCASILSHSGQFNPSSTIVNQPLIFNASASFLKMTRSLALLLSMVVVAFSLLSRVMLETSFRRFQSSSPRSMVEVVSPLIDLQD